MGTGSKKAFRPKPVGTKGKPSAVPPVFVSDTHLNFLITAEQPSPSQGPLPGEPNDTLRGGFQPVTAPL